LYSGETPRAGFPRHDAREWFAQELAPEAAAPLAKARVAAAAVLVPAAATAVLPGLRHENLISSQALMI
jgi:hypothetical protein